MKKSIAVIMITVCFLTLLGCTKAQEANTPAVEEERAALIPMAMVNGTLYLDTGYNSKITERCGTMDGEITSSVNGDRVPTINDQANFGVGYGYQYGAEKGTIEVYINEAWRIFATEVVRKQIQFPENPKQPPALTVVSCDNGVEALSGTASWAYLHEDGTLRYLAADSPHPLQAKEHMPVLPVTAKVSAPQKAYLQWGITPDSVTVRCWSEEYWGQADAKSENIAVAGGTEFVIELKDGNYIYEVIAEWKLPESRGGRACFSFRTEKTKLVRCIN